MTHPAEETLISFAESEEPELTAHVETCADCSAVVREYREIFSAIANSDLGEPASPPPQEMLRLQRRLENEEKEAIAIVAAASRNSLDDFVFALRDLRPTVGLLRAVLAEAERRLPKNPEDAVAIVSLASEIATRLEDYPSTILLLVRADVLREEAYALYYVGRFAEALTAVTSAEATIAGLESAEYDRARIALMRAIILSSLNETRKALPLAQRASEVFLAHGEKLRYLSAQTTVGIIFERLGEHHQAMAHWIAVLDDPDLPPGSPIEAMVTQNIGVAQTELNRPLLARQFLAEAATKFAALEMRSEQYRSEWAIARLLMRTQLFDEALGRLRQLRKQFASLGMLSEADLVSLDILETLLILDEPDEAYEVAGTLLASLAANGLAQSPRAQRALAHLREAADNRDATPDLVATLRRDLDLGRLAIPLVRSAQ